MGVSDGDKISVLRDGREVKVRLHGIDAPEAKQPFGTKAKQFTSEAVFGKVVQVEVRDRDRYGRLVGEVFFNRDTLNGYIVRAGFAWAYREYSMQFVPQEAEARRFRRGLWQDPNPAAPWEFRKAAKPPRGRRAAVLEIPDLELDLLTNTVDVAVGLACAGELARGHQELLYGLERVQAARAAGELWAEALVLGSGSG